MAIERDYTFFKECIEKLTDDVYAQPPDAAHTEWAMEALQWIMMTIYADTGATGVKVLDVGCGQGFMAPKFGRRGFFWEGVTIGEDFEKAREHLKEHNMNPDLVHECDMTFLPFEDDTYDLIFARHVLEHSPFPIITLMEWHRVAKQKSWLCIVAPAPHWWLSGGRNHYSIVPLKNLEWWLKRSGWEPVHYLPFDNRSTSFLKHLTVIEERIRQKSRDEIISEAHEILKRYPEGPVEYRIICKYAPEALE